MSVARSILLKILGLGLILLVGVSILLWGGPAVEFLADKERVADWLRRFGPWAPLVSIVLNTVQVVLAPIPGHVLGLANGYLFGFFMGTVYGMTGLVLGSAIAMTIGRWLGRPVVVHLVGTEKLDKLDRWAYRRGPLFFFLAFLLPVVPDDLACLAVGLSPLSIPLLLLISAIGRLPGMIMMSWIGAEARDMSTLGWALLVGGAILLGGLVLLYRNRMERALVRLARWIERLFRGSRSTPVE